MNEVIYPDKFFRGISNCYLENGYLLPEAFRLDKEREDGYCEISITWCDDSNAFDVIASQCKEDGSLQFPAGISEVIRKELDERMKPQFIQKNLLYERRPTPNNKYHENLLVLGSLNKTIKNMIKSQLALLGQSTIHKNPYHSTNT